MSIVALLLLIFFSLSHLLPYHLQPDEYKETTVFTNLPYKNDVTFEVSDTEAIVAFQFVKNTHEDPNHLNDRLELKLVDQYFSYYFVQDEKVGVMAKKDVIPVVLCS